MSRKLRLRVRTVKNLHDNTRRLILITLFMVLGPILTIGILIGSVVRKLPGNAAKFEYDISIRTGLRWSIDEIEYKTPSIVSLKKVRLIDSVSSQAIFYSPEVEIEYVATKRIEKLFPGLSAKIVDPSDSADNINSVLRKHFSPFFSFLKRPDGFWKVSAANSIVKLDSFEPQRAAAISEDIFFRLFSQLSFLSEKPVQIILEDIGVFTKYSLTKSGDKPDLVQSVRGNIYRAGETIRSDWSFQMPYEAPESVEFLVVRNVAENSYTISFRTGKESLPSGFIANFCSAFLMLGPSSRFSGSILSEYGTYGNWSVKLNNFSLQRLNLAELAPNYTSFNVSGIIEDFTIEQGVFGGGSFAADGHLKISNGEMETALFNRIVENFELTVKPSEIVESPRTSIPFDALVVYFKMRPDGIAFRPDEGWQNVLLYRSGDGFRTEQMLVTFPDNGPQSVSFHQVFSILAPDYAPIVPLTTGLKKVFPLLPTGDVGNVNMSEANQR